ncbi:hypothetical protein [Pseudooceanicola sediminis]|uniref:hypothetical protein n=1 Tax=Pseudooceanicola sediminis TaxID=2211117 RepID=UPI0018F3770A|nr:hypothetical protein [Pseudooceanicola sediminis]|tara:strand:+ start:11375 stop:11539 length:165 start_codon:yes stop_codon:yes gene_type:complete
MDYGKQGAPKLHKNAPRYKGDKSNSGKDAGVGGASSKEELVARMKAAAEAKKKG